jgi:hypothetical protein
MFRIFLSFAVLLSLATSAIAQTVQLENLRANSGVGTKRFTEFGVKQAFTEVAVPIVERYDVDAMRTIRARNESASTASAQPSPRPDRSDSGASSNSNKTFVCKIYCESASGPPIYREFSGKNREEVARTVGDNANSICKGGGFSKSSNRSFDPSQCTAK